MLVLLIVTGFPIALVIAWAFEATPEGIKRTAVADAAGRALTRQSVDLRCHHRRASLDRFVFSRALHRGKCNASIRCQPASDEAARATPQKSIAVLPLLNESGDPKDEYFSDGLSEELIAALAQIRDLKVIGRSSSFRFKDRKEEPKQSARSWV